MILDLEKVKNEEEVNKRMLSVLLGLYFVMLIWIIVFKCNYNEGLHIEANRAMTIFERLALKAIPFQKTFEAVFIEKNFIEIIATIFNVLCFAPMGLALKYFTSTKRAVIAGAIFSLAVEIFQLFSGWGGFDISDVILNALGALAGAWIYDLFASRMQGRTINSFAVCFIAAVLPIDLYAIVNSIINFPG